MELLHFLGYVSLCVSVMALLVVFYHWRFFKRGEKSELGKRLALVFLSDFVIYLSIAGYGLNWVLLDGEADYRVHLKAFQVFSVFFNLYALTGLLSYYKKVV